MQQHLKLPRLLALIPHRQHRLQRTLTQRDAVHQAELVRPLASHVVGEVGGR